MAVAELTESAKAASANYAAMYESLAEDQQVQLAWGDDREAGRLGYLARIVFDAMDAEVHDEEIGVRAAPYCGCWLCWSYLRRGR